MIAPQTPPDESTRLKGLRDLNLLDSPPEERFDRVARTAMALFKTPIALITLVDSNRLYYKSSVGMNIRPTSRDISFCGHAILSDEVMVVSDTLHDPRFADNPQVMNDPHIRFYAGKPLLTTEGATLGTLCIMDLQPRVMTMAEIAALAALGGWAEREIMLSEWQQALTEIDRVHRQLRESEDHYRRILNRVLGPSDPNQNIVAVKPLPQPAIAPVLASSSNGVTKPMSVPVVEDQNTNLPVLLVEDNETNLRLTLLQLKRLGYEADTACTGQQAVDAVASRDYMLVLMDCMMPVMDGLEATRVIRQTEVDTGKHIPIIALTANAIEHEDRVACLNAGMDDYLAKPIDLEQLNVVIRRWNKQTADAGTKNQEARTHNATPAQDTTVPSAVTIETPGVAAATLKAW